MQYFLINLLIFTEMKKEKDLRSKLHSDVLKLVLYYFVSCSYKPLIQRIWSINYILTKEIDSNNFSSVCIYIRVCLIILCHTINYKAY